MTNPRNTPVLVRVIVLSCLIVVLTYFGGELFIQSNHVLDPGEYARMDRLDWSDTGHDSWSDRVALSSEFQELADVDPIDPVEVALAEGLLVIAPPPFSPEVFPCTDCHEEGPDDDPSPTEELYHDEIVLDHFLEDLWCYSCHNFVERDGLHLSNNQPVPFTESYRLCGQCHGTQLRDWKAGDHGKRSGSWSGTKTYLLCAHCHSPHSPKTEPMEPLAPPLRQENL